MTQRRSASRPLTIILSALRVAALLLNELHRARRPILQGFLATLLSLVAATPAHAQPTIWHPIQLTGRVWPAMAYDSTRNITVLFGGQGIASVVNNETWEWNGATWSQRQVLGPPPRFSHAMAYDAARGVTVLFGGSGPLPASGPRPLYNDTWEWDGARWTQRYTAGPSPRYGHAMVYDSLRHVTVLFGGTSSNAANSETWEWDGASWSLQSTAGPSARYLHAMAFDSTRGVTVLYGGRIFEQDTWEWNGVAWSRRATTGLPPRAGAAMAFDASRNITVLFGGSLSGGSSDVYNGETWEWNGSTWTQRAVDPAMARHGAALVFDTARQRLVRFGGLGRPTFFNETAEWVGSAWSVRTQSPPPRSAPAFAYDTARGVGVLFGGNVSPAGSNPLGDTWEWENSSWVQRAVTGPSPRYGHAMAYDAARHVTVLFGGKGAADVLNSETWEWDGIAWTQRMVAGPSPRYQHSLAYDRARGVTVLFGGSVGAAGTPSGETWEWDGVSWVQRPVTGPSPRAGHTCAHDESRGITVLYGGINQVAQEVWEWSGSTWTRHPTVYPNPSSGTAMTYDSDRRLVVLYGPDFTNSPRDTAWEWNGVAWRETTETGPLTRGSSALIYDAAHHSAILFGGVVGGNLATDETWSLDRFCVPPSLYSMSRSSTRCVGASTGCYVQVSGTGPYSFQWRKDGVPIADSPGHIQNATRDNLYINPAVATDTGIYDCVVTNGCGSLTTPPVTLRVNSADFNLDGDVGTDADIEDFFSCLAGRCCLTCGTSDFNGDGDIGTDYDIEAFFRVLAGGTCN